MTVSYTSKIVVVIDILSCAGRSREGRTIDLPIRDASSRGIPRIPFSIPPEINSTLSPGMLSMPGSAPSTGNGYRRALWRVHSWVRCCRTGIPRLHRSHHHGCAAETTASRQRTALSGIEEFVQHIAHESNEYCVIIIQGDPVGDRAAIEDAAAVGPFPVNHLR